MSSLVENATIKIRRDSASNWTSNNPTPASGEMCYETDTGKAKIGDGSTAYNSLDYAIGDMYLIVQDQKTSGTNGGTFNNGAWQTRDLNTVVKNDIINASLSSNQITLPDGTYYVVVIAPAFAVNRHNIRLRNITDGATLLSGVAAYASSSGVVQTNTIIEGIFSIASSKSLEVQHRCESTKTPEGFGVASGGAFSVDHEIYTSITIKKIK